MPESIKVCEYKDIRDIGMRWLCRSIDCRELFLGIKGDWLCSECESKPELDNEKE